jgi:hypothetical protein
MAKRRAKSKYAYAGERGGSETFHWAEKKIRGCYPRAQERCSERHDSEHLYS